VALAIWVQSKELFFLLLVGEDVTAKQLSNTCMAGDVSSYISATPISIPYASDGSSQ
jgi:hypothetical protein